MLRSIYKFFNLHDGEEEKEKVLENGKESIMKKVKKPCMKSDEAGRVKWELNDHVNQRKI